MGLQLSRQQILLYRAGAPIQHRQTNRLYPSSVHWGCTTGTLRANGEQVSAPGYGCVRRANWLRRYSTTVLPHGVHFWYQKGRRLAVVREK